MLESINESLKEQLDKAKDSLSNAMSAVASLKDVGGEKIVESVNELSAGIPLIEEAGFKVDGLNIDLGIPPDISISFSKTNEVSEESIQKLIDDNEDKKILVLVLKALLTANSLQGRITFNKFVFGGVSIKLGIPPAVSLRYK